MVGRIRRIKVHACRRSANQPIINDRLHMRFLTSLSMAAEISLFLGCGRVSTDHEDQVAHETSQEVSPLEKPMSSSPDKERRFSITGIVRAAEHGKAQALG